MRSYFLELEQQLYNIINNSPLGIDGKYYVVKEVFNNLCSTYEKFLNTPEENIEEENTKEVKIEKNVTEGEESSVTVSGKNIEEIVSKAIEATRSEQIK